MIDSLRQIAIFAKAIDHGSFRGAATELRLSPSVISHHIAQLEEKLGVALIYRSTRQLTLTRDGEKLLASAREMLSAAEAGLNSLRNQGNGPSGELNITLPSALSQSKLIDDMALFSKRYPRIQLHIEFSDTRQSLVNEGLDLAVRMAPERKRASNRASLFTAQRCVIAAPALLAEHPEIAGPDDLDKMPWVELEPTRGIKQFIREKGTNTTKRLSLRGQISANDVQAVYRLSRAGIGLAIVPKFLAQDDIASGKIQIVLPDWQPDALEIYAEWPLNALRNRNIQLLVDEFRDA